MQSTLNPKLPDDPHDVLVVAPDVVLVAPTDEELSKLAHIMRHPSGPQARTEPDFSEGPAVPPVDTTFRAVPGDRPSFGARAMRAFVGFLLAVCIGIGAAAWQAYGDTAQELIAKWMPQLTSSPSPENPGLAGQPDPAAVQSSAQSSAQASAATPAPAQPAPPAPTAAEGVAPTAAAPSAAEAPSLQSMARDLAAVGQQVEQQGQHRAAQGEPGTNVPRRGQGFRGQGFRGQGFRDKGFRAEPAAQGIGGIGASAGRRAGAQAAAGIEARANRSSSDLAASRRTVPAAAA